MVTMAVWFASTIIRELIDQAISYYKDQKSWQSSMKAQLDNLSRFQPQIESLIYAAERGDLCGTRNPALEEWLFQLRDAAEEADNVLNELEYRRLKEEADEGKGKLKKTVVKFVLRAAQQDDLLKRLREVVKTFDNLVAGLGTFAQVLSGIDGHISTQVKGGMDRETGSLFTENEFFGREREKQVLIHWLKSSDTKTISVVSIVGVGGVGKTALAQYLFDHQELKGYFQTKMWVCVSNIFEEKLIIEKMLEFLTKKKEEFHTLDAAQRTLMEKLKDQKFLLVLDDVWNDEGREKWKKLMAPLRYGCEGSKILLTTRMESVADMAAKVADEIKMCIYLDGLEERQYSLLFEKYAFHGFDPNDYPRLRLIGGEIARKLRGIPLAMKAIGGMLNNKLEYTYWARVWKDGTLYSDKGSDGIMAALRLSYEHLPTELKPCFRYCSIFSRGHQFYKDRLVHSWISVGLIPEGENRQEEIANEFFETLVRKSFFEPMALYYIMHDLLHELAEIFSKNECLRIASNNPIQIPENIRHLSLKTSNILVLKNLSELKYLRSLLLYCDIEDAELVGVINTALNGFKTVRHLELSSKWLCNFPESIGNLIHLRFLSITSTRIPRLSQCVCVLYHLQIMEFTPDPIVHLAKGSISANICKLSKLKGLCLPSMLSQWYLLNTTQNSIKSFLYFSCATVMCYSK